jgi:hypothetical protein
MRCWAQIDENNLVLRVTVGDTNGENEDGGYQWIIDNLGGTWIECSHTRLDDENKFAAPGYTYDPETGTFLDPTPVITEDV